MADLSRFGRTLVIPEYYRAIHKDLLTPPWTDWARTMSDVQDIVLNIFGFVPFGFFCFIWSCRKGGGLISSAATAVFASGLISLVIELTQVLLPTRSSSLGDLICNIGGGAIGAVLAFKRIKNATDCTD